LSHSSSTPNHDISFRLIAPADVANLVRWQLDPEIVPWWGEANKTEEQITTKWELRASGEGPDRDPNTSRFIIVVDGEDIGEIQSYDLRHYPVEAAEVDVPNSGGMDVFIGEPAWRNRGIGTQIVRKFVDDVVFALPGVETCVIDPDPANKRAIRTYEKAGFTYVKTYYSEANHMNCYLMRQERGQR